MQEKSLTKTSDEYIYFIEELQATFTQGIKAYNEVLICTYHKVGQMLASHRDVSIQDVAKDSGVSERTLQRALQIYNKWQDVEDIYKLPEGEKITVHKLVNIYLPEHKEIQDEYEICPTCHGKGRVKK